MTQYAYPVSSGETDGSWVDQSSGTTLYAAIDDVQPLGVGSDSTYIKSVDGSASADTCTIDLGTTITDPGASASSHIVYFRVKGYDGGMGGSIPQLTVALVEGATNNSNGTVRATTTFTPTSSFADPTPLTLDSTESGNISDYNDLQLRFTRAAGAGMGGGETSFVSQAYMAAPDVPATATENFRVGDRVKETGTGTTGDISLLGAVTGYQTFVAGIGDDNMTYYVIEDANGTAWEVGIGNVTDAGTDLLSRDKIIANSSGTTSALTLSGGTHIIFCGSPSRTELGDVQIWDASDTVTQADSTILADSSGGIFTITMPTAAAAYLGLKFLIKKVTDDANIVTISSAATDFEDDDGSGYSSSIKLYSQGDYYGLMCARVSSSDYRWITVDKYLRPHYITVRQDSAQTIANAFEVVTLDSTLGTSNGITFTDANDKVTIARAGRYIVSLKVAIASANGQSAYCGITVNLDDADTTPGVSPAGILSGSYVTGHANGAYLYISSTLTTDLAVDDTLKLLCWSDAARLTYVGDARQKSQISVTEVR